MDGGERERGVGDERHPRRDQRVAPEQRHVPGRARGDEALVRMIGIEELEPDQVLTRLLDRVGETDDVGVEAREAGLLGRRTMTRRCGH
jgi:hypothetical protein